MSVRIDALPGRAPDFARRLGAAPGRWLLERLLARVEAGELVVEEDGRRRVHGRPALDGLRAALRVHDARLHGDVLAGGALGAAESYLHGRWSSPDLTALLRLVLRNRDVLRGLESAGGRLGRPLRLAAHALRRNTRAGSRRNIEAHYDLGDEFFSLFLDPTMSYSCAWWPTGAETLEEAQRAKIGRVLDLVGLRPGESLLEIGTGWGALAAEAARRGALVTTTTLSPAQAAGAAERFAREGVADRVRLLRDDYRDLSGSHDRLVSIEMVEAVGHEYLGAYFRALRDRLRPGGRVLVQAILIEDGEYERARRDVDFIKRWIFPGCCIPSREILRRRAEEAGLRPVETVEIGPHYARTLAEWRSAFLARAGEARELGLSERFLRAWDYYLAYCEAGFREGALGDAWLVWERP